MVIQPYSIVPWARIMSAHCVVTQSGLVPEHVVDQRLVVRRARIGFTVTDTLHKPQGKRAGLMLGEERDDSESC
jgi:hypothetical protein